MKIQCVFEIQYARCLVGYRIRKSRRASKPWQDGTLALPQCIVQSIDRTVERLKDKELAGIYDKLFSGEKTDSRISGKDYEFSIIGYRDCRLKLKGWMTPEKAPLARVPEAIRKACDSLSSHRWQYDKAHLCITGKDADLEPHGYQAAELLGVNGNMLYCVAHIGKTFAGDDVCLNLTKEQEASEELFDEARKLYLEQATEIICGCGVAGEWTGDDWFMSEAIPFSVRIRASAEETASVIAKRLEKVLANAERELRLADSMLDTLSGWRNEKGKQCQEGTPCKGSVSWMLDQGFKAEMTKALA